MVVQGFGGQGHPAHEPKGLGEISKAPLAPQAIRQHGPGRQRVGQGVDFVGAEPWHGHGEGGSELASGAVSAPLSASRRKVARGGVGRLASSLRR